MTPRLLPVAVAIGITSAATAHAQPGSSAPGVAVDVDDLPPLPPGEDSDPNRTLIQAAADANEDLVVGAAKREQSLGNVASAVTVVSADRLRRFGYRTIAEAIAAVAGIYIQDTRLTQQVGIRGVQIPGAFNSRILVLVDGASINEAWGAFAGVAWDAAVSIDEVARIEVIRGPVGAVYGPNAFFGIINIVTRSAIEGQRVWGRVGLHSVQGAVSTAGFTYGEVNRQLRGSVLAMKRFGETYRNAQISDRELGSDGGETFIASVVGQSGGSFAQLRAYRSVRQVAFAPYDSNPDLDPPYVIYNTQVLAEGGHTRELSKRLAVTGRAYGGFYRFKDDIHYDVDDLFQDYGDAFTVGGEGRARYEVVPDRLGVTAGVELNINRTESRSFTVGNEADGAIVPLDFTTQGVYAELDGQVLPWLGFTAGTRFDRHSVIESAFSKRFSPRGAVFLSKQDRYGAKLLYAEGFRNPSAFEGFFDDMVDFSANPDIEPETIRSYEAVLWGRPIGGMSTRLSGFYWDANDVIEQRPNPMDPTRLQFQNVGRYVTVGVEAEGSYRTSGGWYGFGGLAYAKVGNEESGAGIQYGGVVNAPKVTASGGLSSPKLFDLLHVSGQAVFVSHREVRPDHDGNLVEGSPWWIGLDLCLYVPNLRGFDVTAGARNLRNKRDRFAAPDDFDRFPETMPSVYIARLPGEGRELYLKVGYSY